MAAIMQIQLLIHKTRHQRKNEERANPVWTHEKFRARKKSSDSNLIKIPNQIVALPFAGHIFKWLSRTHTLSGWFVDLTWYVWRVSCCVSSSGIETSNYDNTLSSAMSLVVLNKWFCCSFLVALASGIGCRPKMWWLMNYSFAHFWHASGEDSWPPPILTYEENGNKIENKEWNDYLAFTALSADLRFVFFFLSIPQPPKNDWVFFFLIF